MPSESVSLRIASIFILFIASFTGVILPILLNDQTFKQYVPILNVAAAGVMLGLSFVSIINHSLINCLISVLRVL
jgi:hypothetical protein